MNIARPATGFEIREPSHFAGYLAGFSNRWPRVQDHWSGIKARLKMTGHREGVAVDAPGERVFEALGSTNGRVPTIRVAYHVLGATLTFLAILVIEPID